MEKKLYIVLSTMAGMAVGAAGGQVVNTDKPAKGQAQIVKWKRELPTAPLTVDRNRTELAAKSCRAVERRKGPGRCNPDTIDYKQIHSRNRARGKVRGVHAFDSDRLDVPVKVTPGTTQWLEQRMAEDYCPKVNAIYGEGTCDPATVAFELRDVQTSGKQRTIVEIDVPVFCTGAGNVPVDPNPPQLDP